VDEDRGKPTRPMLIASSPRGQARRIVGRQGAVAGAYSRALLSQPSSASSHHGAPPESSAPPLSCASGGTSSARRACLRIPGEVACESVMISLGIPI
jgi:hypothetical protein